MFDLEFVNNDSENRELVIQVSPQRPGKERYQVSIQRKKMKIEKLLKQR